LEKITIEGQKMAKASMHMEKANRGNHQHNDRSEKVEAEYLLPKQFRKENEVSCSGIEADEKLKKLYENAKENHQKEVGQKLQAKSYSWEAVINLNENHTMKDLHKLVKEIEKETGFTAIQLSIHRDEGHMKKDKNGKEFAVYNIHAHVSFFTLDSKNGKQLMRMDVSPKERIKLKKELEKRHPDFESFSKKKYNEIYREIRKEKHNIIDRAKLSELQTLCADSLKMDRGKKGSNAVRLGHKEYREVQIQMDNLRKKIKGMEKEKNNNSSLELKQSKKELEELKSKTIKEKSEALAKMKDLKEELKRARAELQSNSATRADYAELEQLNKILKKRISEKDLTLSEMKDSVENLDFNLALKDAELKKEKTENKSLVEENADLIEENVDLKEANQEWQDAYQDLKDANQEWQDAYQDLKDAYQDLKEELESQSKSQGKKKIRRLKP